MRESTRLDYRKRILRVLVHIQQNLDTALDLEDLARVAHFSPFHFHRVFRGMVGESVKEHVRRLRLERATMRLRFTEVPVTSIAFEAGYETHEAFTRAFRSRFGVTPSAWRRAEAEMAPPTSPTGVRWLGAGAPEDLTFHERTETDMDARIETLAPRRVAFLRHVGPYEEVGETWMRLMGALGPKGALGPSTLCLGVCHDDPEVTPPDKIRYDACVSVDETFAAEGEVGVQVLDGGDYAIATLEGPYDGLKHLYAELYGVWIPQNGRTPRTGPSFEVYRNGPQDTPPEKLLTDVYVPLEASS
jgi:AraC family transcriptional regulator